MAKRTPRFQADDATVTAPPKGRSTRGRAQSATASGGDTVPQAPGETAQATPGGDTFAARPEANDEAVVDASLAGNRSESMSSEPSDEDIRLRAYQRYLERGGGHGMDLDDWVQAERELRGQKT